MGRFGTAAGLILPIALATATVSLLADGGGRASPSARVELELAALVPLPEGPGRLLVLREKAGHGRVLAFVVQDAPAPPPPRARAGPRAAGGLLGRSLAALGVRVREVEIDRAEEATRALLDAEGLTAADLARAREEAVAKPAVPR